MINSSFPKFQASVRSLQEEIEFLQKALSAGDNVVDSSKIANGAITTEKIKPWPCYQHDLKEYRGLNEGYKYCTKCEHTEPL